MFLAAPVIICGAGISGLAFAQGLLKANIPFRIFERDPALNVRSQGYRVRINSTGIDALRRVLPSHLFEKFRACSAIIARKATAPSVLHLDALTGNKVEFKFNGLPPNRLNDVEQISADRTVLRRVLATGLEDYVEFGKEFSKYEITENGVVVYFSDGSTTEGRLLVGADGTKSRIKSQLLPNHVYVDTEGRWLYGKTTLTPELLQNLNVHAAEGLVVIQDHTKKVPLSLVLEPIRFRDNEFRHELPANYMYWVLGSRKDSFEMDDSKLLSLSREEATAETQKLTSHWHESIRCVFNLQDKGQTSVLRIDSAKPDLPTWETQIGVTLIGDSVHAMSPAAGVGAVSAIRSAAALAQILSKEGFSIDSLRKYEDEMRTFAGEAIKMSFFGGKLIFGMRGFDELEAADGERD